MAVSEQSNSGRSPLLKRRGPLLRALLEVLRDESAPITAAAALDRVRQRVSLQAEELERNASGTERWDTYLRFASAWATAVGWMSKKAGWSLTEAGEAALEEITDAERLYLELQRQYRNILRRRKEPAAQTDPRWGLLVEAMGMIEPGFWTSYGDLGELVGLPARTVGQHIANNDVPNAQRVLRADGSPAPEFRWSDSSKPDPATMLEEEGVRFDAVGRADPAQRLTAEGLRRLLGIREQARRAWLVRGSSVKGANLVPTWLAEGWCSLPASQLPDVPAGVTRDELRFLVDEHYAHVSYSQREQKLEEFDAFLTRMQVGHLIVTTSQGRLYVGEVTGDTSYVSSADGRSNLRRDVAWLVADGVDYTDLPATLTARLQSQHDLLDLTQELPAIEQLIKPTEEPALPAVTFADATDELAEPLLVSREWLQECIELLRDRPQLIFYGPPGTGKTYLAQRLAWHLAGRDNTTLVQFHPAYSYEDFFQGYRPAPDESGTVSLQLHDGPFFRLVNQAIEHREQPYMLIIDEINRGNLAKIFGELYFLLEYRDQAIELLYSSKSAAQAFTLPPNVFLIGTMNTADRSIALVDAAMRRRFSFVALHPSEEPTRSMLDRWLAQRALPDTPARLLDELNARIEDRDFKIGPSYLMRPALYEEEGRGVDEGRGLTRVWRTAIMPLLQEHHYGDDIDLESRYGLAALRAAVARRQQVPGVAAPSVAEEEPAGT
jgi:5-methylcytosine-specific restriction enzyme B